MPTSRLCRQRAPFKFRFSQIGRHNQRGSGQTDPFEIATVWRAWPSCARLERRRYRPLGTVPSPTQPVKIMPTFSATSQFDGPAYRHNPAVGIMYIYGDVGITSTSDGMWS